MDLVQKAGAVVLFIGVECKDWTPEQFGEAARFARSIGCDTIAPKRADGSIKWYGDPGRLAEERAAALAEGCGYLPFLYAYGPRFGAQQIEDEAAVLAEMAQHNDSIVCVDMEAEYNGQVQAAATFADAIRRNGIEGQVICSTWADPIQQSWVGVLQALAPVIAAFGPQQYDNWLAAQEGQFVSGLTLMPELDLSQEFGANDPLAIARQAKSRAHNSVWLWEIGFARSNPDLVRSIAAVMHGTEPPPPPPPPSNGAGWKTYVIQSGDTLSGIAAKLGLGNWYHDLFQPNMETLNAAARRAGHPDCAGGNLIFPGTTLEYRG